MSEIQVFNFLSKFGVEMLILGLIVFLLMIIASKIPHVRGSKLMNYLPYILGIVVYFAYMLIAGIKPATTECMNGGLTVGGLATIMLAVTGNEVFVQGSKRQRIINALAVILGAETAHKIADEILKIDFTDELVDTKAEVLTIIGKNAELDDKSDFCAEYISEILHEREKTQ